MKYTINGYPIQHTLKLHTQYPKVSTMLYFSRTFNSRNKVFLNVDGGF